MTRSAVDLEDVGMPHHKTGARLPFTASVTQGVPLLPLSELIILYSVDILTNLGTPVSKILCNYLRYCLKNGQQCFIGFKNTRRSRVFLDPIKHMLPNPYRNFRFTCASRTCCVCPSVVSQTLFVSEKKSYSCFRTGGFPFRIKYYERKGENKWLCVRRSQKNCFGADHPVSESLIKDVMSNDPK